MPKRLSIEEKLQSKQKRLDYQREWLKSKKLKIMSSFELEEERREFVFQEQRKSLERKRKSLELKKEKEKHCIDDELPIGNSVKRTLEIDSDTSNKRKKKESWDVIYKTYKSQILQGMTHRCYICDRLWFASSVRKISKFVVDTFGHLITNPCGDEVCYSCYASLKNNKTPTLAVVNGFKYPNKPHLPELNLVEERLLSPRVPFMQIRKVGRTMQSKFRGSVINVPVNVETMTNLIPRNLTDDYVINVNFKKRITFKSNYVSGVIDCERLSKWINFLCKSELYIKHNIRVNDNWLTEYSKDKETNDDDFVDEIGDDNLLDVQETLLFDRDYSISMAPGENQKPINLLCDEDVEELSFPTIFYGQMQSFNKKDVTPCQAAKSQIQRYDRRGVRSDHLLFLAMKSLRHQMLSSISIAMKQAKCPRLTARDALNKETMKNVMANNFGFLKKISSTPQYWKVKKRNVNAMIRQLGRPSIFLTMSAAEHHWDELISQISTVHGKKITVEEASKLSFPEKCNIVNSDAVMCASYFDHKTRCIFKTFNKECGPFNDNILQHHFIRVEFQHRGSPHIHALLWLKDAPEIDVNNDEDIESFIDKIITCNIEHPNVSKLQTHKHSFTCFKKRKDICRFGIPFFPMDKTRLLRPLQDDDNRKIMLKSWLNKISNEIKGIELPTSLTFENFLQKLNINIDTYILAIRCSLTRPKVLLKRTPNEIFVNNYNPKISSMLNANMDIQFIFDDYGCASYCVDYINKANRGISLLHEEIKKAMLEKNASFSFREIGSETLGAIEMSAQEAAWTLLGLRMSESSEQVCFIPTFHPDQRQRMLKSNKELIELDEESTSIYKNNILDRYKNRPLSLENICLADFVALYNNHGSLRGSPKIITFCNFRVSENEKEHYREQVMLYIPWRDEILDYNECESLFNENIDCIKQRRQKYSCKENYDEILEKCELLYKENLLNEQSDTNNEFEYEMSNAVFPKDNLNDNIRIEARDIPISKINPNSSVTHDEYCASMRKANKLQKELLLDIIYHKVNHHSPLHLIVTGPAGAGKSFLISQIIDTLTRIHRKQSRKINEKVVLPIAPTGKAAFAIHGLTAHCAFLLPLNHSRNFDLPPLEGENLQKMIIAFESLEYLIIDEISMISRQTLEYIHKRLQEVKQNMLDFGGVSIIAFGDFNQLPPVASAPVYQVKGCIGGSLWHLFKSFELTEIMRQRDSKLFAEALTNYGNGITLSNEQRELLDSRYQSNEKDIPEDCLRLFYDNVSVDKFNNEALKSSENVVNCRAFDAVHGDGSREQKSNLLNHVRRKKRIENRGLENELYLAIDYPYMVVSNVSVEDGLVNGAIGNLKLIEYNKELDPEKLWFQFDDNSIGKLVRNNYSAYMKSNQIPQNLVPFKRESLTIHKTANKRLRVTRQQFPVVLAKAMTIHKSQGSTYPFIAFKTNPRMSRKQIYVAMSRVTSPNGLFYYGDKNLNRAPCTDEDYVNEICRLKVARHVSPFKELRDKSYNLFFIYHNVQSLPRHFEDIISDDLFMKADLLLFSETWTKLDDNIEFPDFYELCRVNPKKHTRQAGGVVIYGKLKYKDLFDDYEELNTRYIQGCVVYLQNHVRYAVFYCHPHSPFEYIINGLRHLLINPDHFTTTVVGDFNIELKSENGRKLIQELYSLNCIIRSNPSHCTTLRGTCIDAIFATENMTAGTYSSYSSYHLPLYGYY